MLIQIPMTETFVNPKYVTSVTKLKNGGASVEFEGNAGYRTRCVLTDAPFLNVVNCLNKEV